MKTSQTQKLNFMREIYQHFSNVDAPKAVSDIYDRQINFMFKA